MKKKCKHCGKVLKRKIWKCGEKETERRFAKRKFCNVDCVNASARTGTSDTAYGNAARKFKKPACETCGVTKKITVHHKDGDRSNNKPSNILTLCPSCHLKWHYDHGRKPRRPGRQQQPFCKYCGDSTAHGGFGLCQKHWGRLRKHGDPMLLMKRVDGKWTLFREFVSKSGKITHVREDINYETNS